MLAGHSNKCTHVWQLCIIIRLGLSEGQNNAGMDCLYALELSFNKTLQSSIKITNLWFGRHAKSYIFSVHRSLTELSN